MYVGVGGWEWWYTMVCIVGWVHYDLGGLEHTLYLEKNFPSLQITFSESIIIIMAIPPPTHTHTLQTHTHTHTHTHIHTHTYTHTHMHAPPLFLRQCSMKAAACYRDFTTPCNSKSIKRKALPYYLVVSRTFVVLVLHGVTCTGVTKSKIALANHVQTVTDSFCSSYCKK